MLFKGIKPKYHKSSDLEFVRAILNSPDKVLGYSSPQQKLVVARLQKQIAGFSDQAIWEFWERHWLQGRSFEEKNLALYFWIDKKNYLLAQKFYKKLLAWAKDLTNWAHSDGLSSLYARMLEEMGEPIDTVLLKWNKSKNPWERRQSIVSLLFYTRQRKKTPSAKRVLSAIKPLLNDEHYYVQKGVGWTLREVYQVDPKLTMTFIETHLHKILPDAYSAAVEKVAPTKRLALKKLRAQQRRGRDS